MRLTRHSGGGKSCAADRPGQLRRRKRCRSVRRRRNQSTMAKRRGKSAGEDDILFSLGHARFFFLVKKIFSRPRKKNSFFSCRFLNGFLVSSPLARTGQCACE